MTVLKDWIKNLKTEKPELNGFITKLEGLISDTGFDALKFEKAVENGLKLKEEGIKKSFESNVEN